MKNIRSISVVNTQMQLINCIEAINYFQITDNWLIIGNFGQKRNSQILNFYKNHKLDQYYRHIINLRLVNDDSIFGFIINNLYSKFVLSILLSLTNFSHVFIGHYLNDIHRYILHKSSLKNNMCKNILVDDGTGTMLFSKIRKKEYDGHLNLCNYSKLSRLLFKYYDKEAPYPCNLIYFSIYPVNELLDFDNIVRNNYSVIKSWKIDVNTTISNNTLLIIGQTLIEENILTETQYFEHLRKSIDLVKLRYDIKNIVYFPHPGETNLNSIKSSISYLSIQYNNEPIELVSLILPQDCIIIGFFSSSLWNISYLRSDMKIYYIPIDSFDSQCNVIMKEHIESTYYTFNKSLMRSLY